MGTTFGSTIRTVADIVQTVTKCSKPQADAAEAEICSKPENVAKLAMACGISTSVVGYGGVLLWSSGASGGATALPGLALIGGGTLAAKKFCSAFVRHSTSNPK